MAGLPLIDELGRSKKHSPNGLRPDPRNAICNQIISTPCVVPKKRKNRGYNKYYYDPISEDLLKMFYEETPTENKYEALEASTTEGTNPNKKSQHQK